MLLIFLLKYDYFNDFFMLMPRQREYKYRTRYSFIKNAYIMKNSPTNCQVLLNFQFSVIFTKKHIFHPKIPISTNYIYIYF